MYYSEEEQLELFAPPEYERDMWLQAATPQDMLSEFIDVYKQRGSAPSISATLINEEFDEWDEAYNEKTSEDELKELADLVYVCFHRAEMKGWDLMEALRRVHQSNMSKLDLNGQPIFREDGKILKGANYEPPNLEDLV